MIAKTIQVLFENGRPVLRPTKFLSANNTKRTSRRQRPHLGPAERVFVYVGCRGASRGARCWPSTNTRPSRSSRRGCADGGRARAHAYGWSRYSPEEFVHVDVGGIPRTKIEFGQDKISPLPRSGSAPLTRIAAILRRLLDFALGYDFFISYAHADGRAYPAVLASALERAGFKVFLDARTYVAGDELRFATVRRVRMSKYLLVIAGSHALMSTWVQREVDIALTRGRRVVVVDLNRVFADASMDVPLRARLVDHIYLTEHSTAQEPSPDLIDALQRSFATVRQETLRMRLTTGLMLVFLALAAFAGAQWWLARERLLESRSRELAAAAILQLDVDPELSLLLATRAEDMRPTEQSLDALQRSVLTSRVRRTLTSKGGAVSAFFVGDFVVALAKDGALRVWSGNTLEAEWKPHDQPPLSVQRVADNRLLTVGAEGSARLWNNAGQLLTTFQDPAGPIESAAMSAKGTVATATSKGVLRLWTDWAGQKNPRAPDALPDTIGDGRLTFSNDGAILLTDGDGTGALDVSGRRAHDSPGVNGIGDLGSLSPKGDVAVVPGDEEWLIWDTRTGKEVFEHSNAPGDIKEASFSSDGDALLVRSAHRAVVYERKAFGWANGVESEVRVGTEGDVTCAGFSPDGKLVMTANGAGLAQLWTRAGRLVATLRGHSSAINAASFNHDGSRLVTGSDDGTVRVWNVLPGQRGLLFDDAEVAFSPDWRHLVAARPSGTEVWDLAAGRRLGSRPLLKDAWGIEFDSASTRYLAITESGVSLVPLDPGASARVIDKGAQLEARFDCSDRCILTGGPDRLRIWDAETGALVAELPVGLSSDVFVWSDRAYAATRAGDGLLIWNLRTRSVERRLRCGVTNGFGASPADRSWLMYWDSEGVCLWDLSTGRLLRRLDRLLWVPGLPEWNKRKRPPFMFESRGAQAIVSVERGAAFIDLSSGEQRALFQLSTEQSRTPREEARSKAASVSPDGRHVAIRAAGLRLFAAQGGPPRHVFTDADCDAIFDSTSTYVRCVDKWFAAEIATGTITSNPVEVDRIFGGDGRWFLSAGSDSRVIRDMERNVTLAERSNYVAPSTRHTVSADGRWVVWAPGNGRVYVDHCDVCVSRSELLDTARSRITRPLTDGERSRYAL
jgi:WD40 repeat protein